MTALVLVTSLISASTSLASPAAAGPRTTSRAELTGCGPSAEAARTPGSQAAFGPFPDATDQKVFEYGAINLIILGIGIGLVHVGARWRARREARTAGTVSLEPAGTRS